VLSVHDFEYIFIGTEAALSGFRLSRSRGSVFVQLLILLPTVSTNDLVLSCFTSRLLSAATLKVEVEVEVVGDNVADLSLE
jgi:hypothetical protein